MIVSHNSLGALGADTRDAWEKWCDDGGAKKDYGGSLPICKMGSQGKGALVAFTPPWTIAGRQARFTLNWGIPAPSEYEPQKLFVTAFVDPVRYAYLAAFAGVVTLPLSMAGAIYVGLFTPTIPPPPMGGIPNPAWGNGFAIALAQVTKDALQAGEPVWQRAWDRLFAPIVQNYGDQLMALVTLGPTPAAALQIFLKKEALRANPPHSPEVKAFLLALAENADFLAQLKQGPDVLKEDWAISKIGTVAEQQIAPQIPGTASYLVQKLGRALRIHSKAISYLLKGKAQAALDEFAYDVIGIRPFYVVGVTEQNLASIRSSYQQANANGSLDSDEAMELLHMVQDALETLMQAISSIQWASLGDIINDGLQVFYGVVSGKITTIENLKELLDKKPAPPKSNVVAAGTSPFDLMTKYKKSGTVGEKQNFTAQPAPPPKSQSTTPPAAPPANPLVGIAAAAATGAVVGGVPGAAIGAGAALLLRKKQ